MKSISFPNIDSLSVRRMAVEADADVRSVQKEIQTPGSVRGRAGERIRAVLERNRVDVSAREDQIDGVLVNGVAYEESKVEIDLPKVPRAPTVRVAKVNYWVGSTRKIGNDPSTYNMGATLVVVGKGANKFVDRLSGVSVPVTATYARAGKDAVVDTFSGDVIGIAPLPKGEFPNEEGAVLTLRPSKMRFNGARPF